MITIPTSLLIYIIIANTLVLAFHSFRWNKHSSQIIRNSSKIFSGLSNSSKSKNLDDLEIVSENETEYLENLRKQIIISNYFHKRVAKHLAVIKSLKAQIDSLSLVSGKMEKIEEAKQVEDYSSLVNSIVDRIDREVSVVERIYRESKQLDPDHTDDTADSTSDRRTLANMIRDLGEN